MAFTPIPCCNDAELNFKVELDKTMADSFINGYEQQSFYETSLFKGKGRYKKMKTNNRDGHHHNVLCVSHPEASDGPLLE